MSRRTDRDYLADIREAVRRILLFSDGMTPETFIMDIRTQDAVVRNLEIMGEATKSLTSEFRANHPEIPWKSIAGVRDRLIHHYFGVNLDIVWQIVTDELPDVAIMIDEVLGEES